MFRLAVVVTFLSSAAYAEVTPIIGGTATTVGQYPTVVGIEVGQGLCTGILVTPNWIMTAGHCVDPDVVLGGGTQAQVTASVKVHFNTININPGGSQGMVVTASDTIMDPMFNVNTLGSHDMGLIKLSTPVTTVTPSPVNLVAANAPVGMVLDMVGFGTTQPNGQSAGIEFELKGLMATACATIESDLSDANLLCYPQTSGKGKCEGDSGGPSFAMVNGVATVVGVTSFGDQSCQQFGTDTRTDAESAFILAHIPELQCTVDTDCAMGKTCFQHSCIGQPFTAGGLGFTCTMNGQCDTGVCGTADGEMKCSAVCTVGGTGVCPDGFDCLGTAGAPGACWPASTDGGGCCDAGRHGAPTMLLGIGLVGLMLRRRRR